jgi:mRNA-degrading endonuclease RelE of RelBE toxin-antitoxin system
MKKNPYDSRLHAKHLSPPMTGLLSFRITRDWRVNFQFLDAETIFLVDVAHRKDIYR